MVTRKGQLRIQKKFESFEAEQKSIFYLMMMKDAIAKKKKKKIRQNIIILSIFWTQDSSVHFANLTKYFLVFRMSSVNARTLKERKNENRRKTNEKLNPNITIWHIIAYGNLCAYTIATHLVSRRTVLYDDREKPFLIHFENVYLSCRVSCAIILKSLICQVYVSTWFNVRRHRHPQLCYCTRIYTYACLMLMHASILIVSSTHTENI